MSDDLSIVRGPGQWAYRAFSLVVHELLRRPRFAGLPEQDAGGKDAGGYCLPKKQSWPRRNPSVRAPDFGETPLSRAEIEFAVRRGLL
jgi:hypothetical protein